MESHEDEAFNDVERQAKQRKEAVKAAMRRAEDDDDIQVYQRPWVGLTDEEIEGAIDDGFAFGLNDGNVSNEYVIRYARVIEAKLKEKNT